MPLVIKFKTLSYVKPHVALHIDRTQFQLKIAIMVQLS